MHILITYKMVNKYNLRHLVRIEIAKGERIPQWRYVPSDRKKRLWFFGAVLIEKEGFYLDIEHTYSATCPKNLCVIDGKVYEKAYVRLHFSNGDSYIKHFDTPSDREGFVKKVETGGIWINDIKNLDYV